jgi:hypothetical protein
VWTKNPPRTIKVSRIKISVWCFVFSKCLSIEKIPQYLVPKRNAPKMINPSIIGLTGLDKNKENKKIVPATVIRDNG